MYTVVYVLTDNDSLKTYNELMKSLISLRIHMPEQRVCVLTDNQTYDLLKKRNVEVFNIAEVLSVEVDDNYSMVEKSRFIKTSLRQRLKGDLLYIDTDTVICAPFPNHISDKSIGMVLEGHMRRNTMNCFWTDWYDAKSGLDLNNYDLFYNSGIVWSKDDEHAHRIYKNWHSLWKITRTKGTHRDQSPLNYVIQGEENYIEMMDGIWNCQVSALMGTGLCYLADALIIHYFHLNSPYKLCLKEYRDMPYNDKEMLEMLQHPKSLFSKHRVVRLDDNNQIMGIGVEDIYYPLRKFRRNARMRRIKRNYPVQN